MTSMRFKLSNTGLASRGFGNKQRNFTLLEAQQDPWTGVVGENYPLRLRYKHSQEMRHNGKE
ncbi:hypothetical protein PsorP6_004327 [Peronosclerospora sorghi]|uniref:Uncharacterized protein n=1 Tax=Peronosclerospora sorghi TaxID=230839 RepID=A0ACC0VKC6_9STRA|nr:hypothetical protein PsorP6_004327 [Peronosclerospora sorghi]